jgi:hypothetical protein
MHTVTIRRFVSTIAAIACAAMIVPTVAGQSFNIDLDVPGSPPSIGGGVPSNAFGAASGQTGVWNSVPTTAGPVALVNISGAATGVSYSVPVSSTTISTLGFNNGANTGDFALLFNDGQQVGTVVQGGTRTYRFTGLADGLYSIYTYASPPQGIAGDIAITIAGSNEGTLMTAGAMTPNTFTLGVTHVIHTINLAGGILNIDMVDTPGSPSAYVSGFQITLVPGPGSLLVLAALPLMHRRRRRA